MNDDNLVKGSITIDLDVVKPELLEWALNEEIKGLRADLLDAARRRLAERMKPWWRPGR